MNNKTMNLPAAPATADAVTRTLFEALDEINALCVQRRKEKQSNSRLKSAAREIGDIIKVLSTCGA